MTTENDWLPPAEWYASLLMDPVVGERLPAALRARQTGRAEYLVAAAR